MAEKASPVITINDFPAEIIEQFATDLHPQTISKMRLVSPRFYEVFRADRFYQYYLRYPDRPDLYQRDLNEFGNGKDCWRRCLEAEKRRLGNWRNGRLGRVETVDLLGDLSPAKDQRMISPPKRNNCYQWQGKTDERNEDWMLCECNDWKIILLNVTDKPIMSVHDVSAFAIIPESFAILLPGQVIIRGLDELHVFNVTKVGEKLSLEHLFVIEERDFPQLFISGKSSITNTHKNLYIKYKDWPTDGILQIWDLKEAVKLESIVLIELLSQKWAVDWDKIVRPKLEVSNAEFPNVLVMLSFTKHECRHKETAVALVNVEKGQLVHWFGEVHRLYLEYCTFKGHTVCVKFDLPQADGEIVMVYDLRKCPTLEADQSAIIFKFESKDNLYVHYENTTMIIMRANEDKLQYKLHIASFDGPEVTQREISLNIEGFFFISIIEPFFVAKHSDNDGSILTSFDMFGRPMFDWAEVLSERGIVGETANLQIVKDVDFQSLSKCVLQNKKGDNLHICFF